MFTGNERTWVGEGKGRWDARGKLSSELVNVMTLAFAMECQDWGSAGGTGRSMGVDDMDGLGFGG